MVLTALILSGIVFFVVFKNSQNGDEADELRLDFYLTGDVFKKEKIRIKTPQNIPVHEARKAKKETTKVKYRWVNTSEVIYYCPIRFLERSLRPIIKYHAKIENNIAEVTGRYSSGWKFYNWSIILVFPIAALVNLLFDFEPIDLIIIIFFGIPIYVGILWQLKKEPALDMPRGIECIIEDCNQIKNDV